MNRILLHCQMLCLLLALAFSATAQAASAKSVTRDDVAAVLRENPQLVYEALRQDKAQLLEVLDAAITERDAQERRQRLAANLANPLKPELDETRPYLGPAAAPVTIVEYSDFLCAYCGRGSQTIQELMRRNPGKIRVFFKHFPNKAGSVEPAAIFEALGRQDKALAWKFADQAFAAQASLSDGSGRGVAAILGKMGLDYKKFKKDSESREILSRIEADVQEARRFGVDGTPTFLVNGILVRGAVPIEELEHVLGLVLAK